MRRLSTRWWFPLALTLAAAASAQAPHQWVVPGRAVLAQPGCDPIRIAAAAAQVRIADRTAATTLEVELHNTSAGVAEAVLLLPLPDGAAVSGFAFEGAASEPTAQILLREDARRLYDEITAKLRDPALLEFMGWNCLRSSVFPVPAGGRQKVRLTYEHVLEADGERVDYVLPRSEMLSHDVPWTIAVELQAGSPIGICHSPSHELTIVKRSASHWALQVEAASRRAPGAFRLCFTTQGDSAQPTAAIYAYPDPTIGGGYFLLLATAPRPERSRPLRRELTLVIDRSGSMAGRKLDQAKAAARQVLEGLAPGEGIQIVDYGNDVGSAFPQPVAKDATTLAAARAYLDGIRPHGGTNIHDALLATLQAPTLPGTLPLVLFLTDGLPTVGPTSERELHALVAKGNPHDRRIFCFGVGNDVNVPLLDRLAEATRAVTAYVLPEEDVEVKVARTFARLDHPVLAAPRLDVVTAQPRLFEVLPRQLPDLFAGDQLVVLGQYRGAEDLHFRLRGRTPAGEQEYAFSLPVRSASVAHGFVPRLWASRQIAFLVDELRQQGGDLGGPLARSGVDPFADPRLRELRDEILRLSTRFGVLGEYTAFLATEGSRLDDWQALGVACQEALAGRAVATRSGAAAVNQGCNLWAQKQQSVANLRNSYLDHELNVQETTAIQQVCDRAFFRRGSRWIDGNSVLQQRLQPDSEIEFGSVEFFTLLRRLEAERRNGVLSLQGEILLEVDGKNVLIKAPPAPSSASTPASIQNPKETIR